MIMAQFDIPLMHPNKVLFMRQQTILPFTLAFALFPLAIFATNYETPGQLPSSQILPSEWIEGPDHSIGAIVSNDGYMNTYQLRTGMGDFEVTGTYFLQKRLVEHYAVLELEEKYPSGEVAIEAVVDAGGNMVRSTVQGTVKALETVTDGEKIKETVKKVPGGLVNLFGAAAKAVGHTAVYAYETGKSVVQGSDSEGKTTGERVSQAGDFLKGAAKEYLGYNKAYRDLALALKVDPYTENAILQKEMKRVATLQSAVSVGSRFVGIPSIPFVGEINTYYGYAEKAAAFKDPKVVAALNETVLKALAGDSEEKQQMLRGFTENEFYNPASRRMITAAIDDLQGVGSRDALVIMASHAASPVAAHFFVSAAMQLRAYHTDNEPLLTFIEGAPIPSAITQSNQLVIALPVDYLLWTQNTAVVLTQLQKQARGAYNIDNTVYLLGGDLSPRCRQELSNLGRSEFQTHFQN